MRFGKLPAVAGVLHGVKPVVIAVVLQALWGLGRTALKTRALGLLAVASIVSAALGANELVILFVAGMVMAIIHGQTPITPFGSGHPLLMSLGPMLTTESAGSIAFGLWPLFAVFVKSGAVLFGSGYVLLAFLRADLVERLHWITEAQLLDAIAVGQITPGPVFTTATFIGYILAGRAGAAVATIGIFLPAFIFVALSAWLLPLLRRSPITGAVLDGVNVASLALMAVVTWTLGRSALVDVGTVLIFGASAILLVRYRVNSAWLVLGGTVLGFLIY